MQTGAASENPMSQENVFFLFSNEFQVRALCSLQRLALAMEGKTGNAQQFLAEPSVMPFQLFTFQVFDNGVRSCRLPLGPEF